MNITELLGSELKKQALKKIASSVWGDSQTAQSIIQQALPTILGGLEKNTQTPEWLEALDSALEKHTGTTKIDIADGKNILGHIFGDNTSDTVSGLASSFGISDEQSSDVMGILSSLVMEKLWDQKAAGVGKDIISQLLSGSSKQNMLGMVFDQDGDGDFDKNDAMKFGMNWIKNKFLSKK